MASVFDFLNIATEFFKFVDHIIFVSKSTGVVHLLASVNNFIIYAN